MIDWTQVKMLPNEILWMLMGNNIPYELTIEDVNGAPEPEGLEIAKQVMPFIDNLEKYAKSQLDFFIKYDATVTEWELIGVEFGVADGRKIDEFDLCFTLGLFDVYGLYHVRFKFRPQSPTYSFPVAFGRKFW